MSSHRTRWTRGLVCLAAVLAAACGPAGSLSNSEVYKPPPPLALVVLVDPSAPKLADELRQLRDVIQTGATPGESVVVMFLQPSFGQAYTVRHGDNLSAIAASHGLTLAALETANPQLGPLSGRNWKLIYAGERVMIPNGAGGEGLLLVSKAPNGPPPPELIRLPRLSNNPTEYQRAQYERAVAADKATNDARIAAWRAEADRVLQPWKQQVTGELDSRAGSPPPGARPPDPGMLSATMAAGLTTLQGLPGRRMLLVLGGGEIGPGTLAPRSLADVNLVVANLTDSRTKTAWAAAATTAGAASVSALDVALTRLQLAQVVNQ
jgi:LysM repeat protein